MALVVWKSASPPFLIYGVGKFRVLLSVTVFPKGGYRIVSNIGATEK